MSILEKGVPCEMVEEKIWEKSDELIRLEQAGVLPVLVDEGQDGEKKVISWSIAIDRYLEETFPESGLLGDETKQKFNILKLINWFDQKFYAEVTHGIVHEKIIKRFSKTRSCPNSGAIRSGIEQMYYHLEYMTWLLEYNDWLAGDFFSLADISAAAQLSTLDYLDQIPWGEFPDVKIWYAKIKSRPSFRPVLRERIASLAPSPSYADLDF